jgi:hypothetical protein
MIEGNTTARRDEDGVETPLVVEYDRSVTPPSTAVAEAIASVEGTDPVALATTGGIVLYDHVEPDALDRLLGDETGDGVAADFAVGGYAVWLDGNRVVVSRADDP